MLGWLGYIPIALLILTIAMPVSFLAMNPNGFMMVLAEGGKFIMVSVRNVILGGFQMVKYAADAFWRWIGNIFIGGLNLITANLNSYLGMNVPLLDYIPAAEKPAAIDTLMNEITQAASDVKQATSDYVQGVQENAPQSYVQGAAAGVGSAALTNLIAQKKIHPSAAKLKNIKLR